MNSKSFTLIELLVVISILGLLSSLVLIGLQGAKDQADVGKAQEFSHAVRVSLGADLIGEWRLNDEADPTKDSSGSGNDGNLLPNGSEPTYVDGIFDKALSFDGIDDYVDFPNTVNEFESGDHTFTVWTKSTGARSSAKFILCHYNWSLKWASDTQVRFTTGRMNNGTGPFYSVTADVSDKKDDWLFLSGVYKPSAQKLLFYVNGEFIDEANIGTDIIYTGYGTQNLRLAKSRHGASTYYQGIIDEVHVYNKALSSAEIQQHYVQGAIEHDIVLK